MRQRRYLLLPAVTLVSLLTAALASGAPPSPVAAKATVRRGGVAIRVHAACTARVKARVADGFAVLAGPRTVTVRAGATRTVSLTVPRIAQPVEAQVSAHVLPRGCRSSARKLSWQTVGVVPPRAGSMPAPAAAPPAPIRVLPLPIPALPPVIPATPASNAAKLAWAPPELTNPIVVNVSNQNRALVLRATRDYVVRMPPQPLTASGGLVIVGGHNVVLIGGEIDIPWQGTVPPTDSRRALYLKEQTGTVHVEGLLLTGPDLSEGIDLDERQGNTVQIENVRIEQIHARDELHFTDNHPDLIQSWGGPGALRVDHLTGSTDYQGFFLHPQQFDPTAVLHLADLRNVQIVGNSRAGYLLWQADPFAKSLQNVWVVPNPLKPSQTLWPNVVSWPGVHYGAPPGGDFVPARAVGPGYVSPGYAQP